MKFVTRSSWGAKPPRYPLRHVDGTKGVKVHYEGTYVPKSLADSNQHLNCQSRVRDVQTSHMANAKENYSDIAYNAMVCPHGYVYEGRGAHYETGANGNQALNLKDYAVCAMVGNSGLVQPTNAQLDAIVDAIEWLRSSGGAGSEVLGHRDGYATSCPGDPLYKWIHDGYKRIGVEATTPGAPVTPPSSSGVARYRVTIGGLEYGFGAHGNQVTRVGKALVKKGFGKHYTKGPGPEWTDADTRNYSDYQISLGYKGVASHQSADGVPGEPSLRKLLGTIPRFA